MRRSVGGTIRPYAPLQNHYKCLIRIVSHLGVRLYQFLWEIQLNKIRNEFYKTLRVLYIIKAKSVAWLGNVPVRGKL